MNKVGSKQNWSLLFDPKRYWPKRLHQLKARRAADVVMYLSDDDRAVLDSMGYTYVRVPNDPNYWHTYRIIIDNNNDY